MPVKNLTQICCAFVVSPGIYVGMFVIFLLIVILLNFVILHALIDIPCSSLSVFLMFSGLVVYPVGFGSTYFRFYCGDPASDFRSGACHIGWTYMLAIAGNALSIFCPIFSYFSESETDKLTVQLSPEKI